MGMKRKKTGAHGAPNHDPFSDDDEENTASADEATLARFNAANGEDDDPEEFEVDAEPAGDEEPGRPSRTDRKQNRFRAAIEERDAAIARQAASEARAAAAEQRALAAENARLVQPQHQPNRPDPLDAKLEDIYAQQDALSDTYRARGAQMSEAEHKEMRAKARKLDADRITTLSEKAHRQLSPRMTAAEVEQAARTANIKDRYSDIMAHEKATAYVTAKHNMLVAQGFPDNTETADIAAEEGRSVFGLPLKGTARRQPDSTPQQRSQFASSPRGGGGAAPAKPNTIRITKDIRSIALSNYAHLKDKNGRPASEQVKIQTWVNGPGKAWMKEQKGQRG